MYDGLSVTENVHVALMLYCLQSKLSSTFTSARNVSYPFISSISFKIMASSASFAMLFILLLISSMFLQHRTAGKRHSAQHSAWRDCHSNENLTGSGRVCNRMFTKKTFTTIITQLRHLFKVFYCLKFLHTF